MGGGSSKVKTATDQINQTALTIATTVVQNCSAISTQDQTIDFSGNRGTIDLTGATIKQTATVDLACALSANNKSTIAATISSMLTNTLTAKTSFAATGKASTSSAAAITNTVTGAINNLTSQTLASLIKQRQSVDYSNNTGKIIGRGMTISQSAQMVAQGFVDAVNATGITADVAAAVTNNSAASNEGPLDAFANLIGDYGVYILIFFVIVLAAIGLYVFWPSDSDRRHKHSTVYVDESLELVPEPKYWSVDD